MLKLAGGRQDNIGITGSIGFKEFMDNGKEVVAQQTFDNFSSIRRRGDGIGVVDIERIDRRISFSRQKSAKTIHIQGAWHGRTGRFMAMRNGFRVPLSQSLVLYIKPPPGSPY